MTCDDLLDFYDKLNKLIYDRAYYLKCFKDDELVPLQFRNQQAEEAQSIIAQGNLANSINSVTRNGSATPNSTHPPSASSSSGRKSKTVKINLGNNSQVLKSGSRAISEDPALAIMKNILQ